MGKKSKKNENAAMPMFQGGPLPVPPVPFAPPLGAWKQTGNQDGAKDDASEKKENIKSTVKSFWTQQMDMRKSTIESNKEQWNKFFGYLMSLPDDLSSLPYGQLFCMAPKDVMKRLKEFEEMANQHFVEQADSFADFCIQGEKQLYDFVATAMDSAAKKDDEAEEEKAPAEEAAEK